MCINHILHQINYKGLEKELIKEKILSNYQVICRLKGVLKSDIKIYKQKRERREV